MATAVAYQGFGDGMEANMRQKDLRRSVWIFSSRVRFRKTLRSIMSGQVR